MATRGSNRSERRARQEYVHDRQKMVVTYALIFLVACLTLALLVCFNVVSVFFGSNTAGPEDNYGVTAPCVPDGATAVEPSEVTVRVLNGTNKSGIAQAVSEALNDRGFAIEGIGNANKTYERTEILTGKNTLPQAYTLYAQFSNAILRMDNRTDSLIDVVIGNNFDNLKATDKITVKTGSKLTSIRGCVAADKMTDVPKALPHTPVSTDDSGKQSQ